MIDYSSLYLNLHVALELMVLHYDFSQSW